MIEHFYVGAVPNDEEQTVIPDGLFDLMYMRDHGVVNIEGLDRPDADIVRTPVAGANASLFDTAQIKERNIVIKVRPWIEPYVHKRHIEAAFPFGQNLRFYIESVDEHDTRKTVFIDGYVEKCGGWDYAKHKNDMLISIICPFPWFQSVRFRKIKLKYGDTPIDYRGDIPAGFTLYVPAQKSPPLIGGVDTLKVTIGDHFFRYLGGVAVPKIVTIEGKRQFTGSRFASEGDTVNVHAPAFGALDPESEWIQIEPGTTKVNIYCTAKTQDWFNKQNEFSYRDTYSGV